MVRSVGVRLPHPNCGRLPRSAPSAPNTELAKRGIDPDQITGGVEAFEDPVRSLQQGSGAGGVAPPGGETGGFFAGHCGFQAARALGIGVECLCHGFGVVIQQAAATQGCTGDGRNPVA